MKKPSKTAQELKTMIAAEMLARGLAIDVSDVLILRSADGWRPGMHRVGDDADVGRLAAMSEIARELGRTYRYARSPGLSRNSAAAYV
jgi:hypothetical protein